MWIYYKNKSSKNCFYGVKNLEEGIDILLDFEEKYGDAYLEYDGKRIYARDIQRGQSIEEITSKVREITTEEYIKEIDEDIELSDGYYDGFELADTIKDVHNSSTRVQLTLHYIEKFSGIPAFTDYIARTATPEERKLLLQAYEENGISIDRKIFEPKIWIVPNNDLEARTIIQLLEDKGEKHIITNQAWGASWEMLEPEVFKILSMQGLEVESEYIDLLKDIDQEIKKINAEISKLSSEIDEINNKNVITEESIEIISRKKKIEELEGVKAETLDKRQSMASDFLFSINRQANEKGITIYGIELQGNSRGSIDVDHHNERSNEKASIQQVADIIGADLTIYEKFVAANDKGSIQAMEELGDEYGLSKDDLQEIILYTRRRDRETQGITLEQEAQAEEAIRALGDITGKDYVLVDGLPHSKTATIMDRLYAYGIYGKNGNVLITSKDGETNFYGSTEIIEMLDSKFKVEDPNTGRSNCWCGGSLDQGYGFWGGKADQEAIKREVEAYINAKKKEQQGHNDPNEKSVDDE